MSADIDKTVHLLGCLEKTANCPFVWKATAALLVKTELPQKHRMHVHEFCAAVKAIGRDYEMACMRNDSQQISRRALQERKAFINICHAGVAELVIPVFSGDSYLGVILCGPFVNDNCHCRYKQTHNEYNQLQPLSDDRADAITEVTVRIVRDAPLIVSRTQSNDFAITQLGHVTDKRIHDTLSTLNSRFRGNITAREMARYCALSLSRFLHLFKEQTGMNFSEYLQRLRISEARHLLAGTDLQMSEIAAACGISDQSRLAALFRRYFKISPLAYRKQVHEELSRNNLR